MYLLATFIEQNFKKIVRYPKMVHLPQRRIFFRKTNYILFMYLLDPFIEQNFKKMVRDSKMVHLPQSRIFSE